jgi:hypothetical protein
VTTILSRRILDFLTYGLAVFFCVGTIIAHLSRTTTELPVVHEAFDPKLQSITNVDAAAAYVRAQARSNDPATLADAADEFVRLRFYHSYSFFDARENWLAYLAGFAWINLRSPVLPDDILHHPQAACSQQAMVFQAIVRKFGLDSGVVRFKNHMVAAVKIAGAWRVYDADREISPRSYALSAAAAGDPRVVAIYGPVEKFIGLTDPDFRRRLSVDDVDANPANHASLFHRVTGWLSSYGWIFFLGAAFLRLARRPRTTSRTFGHQALS